MKTVYRNLHYLDPTDGTESRVDLVFDDERVVALNPAAKTRTYDDSHHVVNQQGKNLSPGFVDLCAFTGEPGFEVDEDLETFSRAAAAGGFTTVAPRPDTEPPCDRRSAVEALVQRIAGLGLVDVAPIGCATVGNAGKDLAEIGDLRLGGARAVGSGDVPLSDGMLMRRVLEYAACFDLPVFALPQNANLTGKARVNEGEMSTRLGLAGAPALAEEVEVFRDLKLAEHTGSRLHLQKLSTARAVQLVRDAKHQGVKVTADVAVHHLLLTEKELAGYDTNLYVVPPLRTNEDRLALIEGLKDGTLDAIVTDHNPVNRRYKEVEFGLARPGMIGLETALPLLLRLVKRGVLPLKTALRALTVGPAKVLGLDAGTLREGGPATFVLWDEAASWRCTKEGIVSKSRNTPFLNWELQGKIVEVRKGGKVVSGG